MEVKAFENIYNQRHDIGARYKAEGKLLAGTLSNYVPEELLYAAGIVPIRIRGREGALYEVDRYLPPNICSYLKGCLDEGLLGKYDYLDGFVTATSCDAIHNFYSIYARLLKPTFSFFLAFPSKNTPEARKYFIRELQDFQASLEEYIGTKISDEALGQAIEIYDQNRRYLTQIRQSRLEGKCDIAASEFLNIVMSGYVMDKKEHNQLLKDLISGLTDTNLQKDNPSKQQDNLRLPLAVCGNTFEGAGLFKLLEKHGCDLVLDDFQMSAPYYLTECPENNDPIASIADRYLGKTPEPNADSSFRRIGNLIKNIKEYGITGVINLTQKFCDEYMFENVVLEQELKKNGIPYLFLDTDDSSTSSDQYETRIQAFTEMLKGVSR